MILAALAAAAWLAIGLGAGARTASSGARRLVPDVAAADVISVELRRGDASISARRTDRGFVDASGTPSIDAAAMETLLAAVEYTWVRRLRRHGGTARELGLAEPRAILMIGTGARVRELRLGAALGDRELAWVGVDGDAALITATEAGQLFPGLEALRDRRPFRGERITGLEVIGGAAAVVVSGGQVAVAGGKARVDADELEAIAETLRGLQLDAGSPGAARPPLTVRASSDAGVEWVEVRYDCRPAPGPPGGAARLYASAAIGDGCVDAAPLEALRALDPARLVDGALIDPQRRFASVTLRRGAVEVVIDPRSDGREAALEWLTALAAIDAGPPRPAAPGGEPAASLEVRYNVDPADRIELRRAGAAWIARRNDEPVELPVPGIGPLLDAEPVWFRARELIERDPTELRSARRGGAELARVIVAPLVAHLTALRFVATTARPEHGLARPRAVIDLVFDRPPINTGDPNAYRLEIGAEIDGGCFARLAPGGDAVFVLGAPTCDALLR